MNVMNVMNVMNETVTNVNVNVNVNIVGKLILPTEVYLTGKKSLGRDIYSVDGISFQDSTDQDAEKVRVDLEVVKRSGTLSLNEEYLPLADFSSCSVRTYSDWMCRGDGNDRIMTFVAESRNIGHILKNMTFTPYFNGNQDEVMIIIYEGQGGDCLDAAEHSGMTIYHGCTHHVGYINLPPAKDTKLLPGATKSGLSQWEFGNICDSIFSLFGRSYVLLGLSIGGIVLLLVLVVIFYFKCISNSKRKAKSSCPDQTEDFSSRV
jgi:hypothetical protein